MKEIHSLAQAFAHDYESLEAALQPEREETHNAGTD
jgi:hypothetical protein